jgi:hypothetical protein
MDAARLAEILSNPTISNLTELHDNAVSAAIPGLKVLASTTYTPAYIVQSAQYRLILACLGACVMAAENESLDDKRVHLTDSTEEACGHRCPPIRRPGIPNNFAAPAAPETTHAIQGAQEILQKSEMAKGHPDYLPRNKAGSAAFKAFERSEAGDERLLEDIEEYEMPMPERIRAAVARGWCYPVNEKKTMDGDLALAISEQVGQLVDEIIGELSEVEPSGDAYRSGALSVLQDIAQDKNADYGFRIGAADQILHHTEPPSER